MPLIKSLKISWLTPQRIKQLSFAKGNFKIINNKTINAKTLKSEFGGLFDPRIFGPFRNYECYCGKYKGKENKVQKCERCEVLIAEKNLQRWRMGHISLPVPITNIALFKSLATNLSKLLGIPVKRLEGIIYCWDYVVVDNGLTNLLKKRQVFEKKKIDPALISSILQEIIQSGKLSKSIIGEAEELNEKIITKNKKEDAEAIFWDDFFEFLEKHGRIKI